MGRNSEENLNLNCTPVEEMIRETNCNDEKEDGRISAMKKRRGEENFNIKKKKKEEEKIQPENRIAKEELQGQKSAARTPRKGILST